MNKYRILIKELRNLSGSLVLFTQLWDEGGNNKGESRNNVSVHIGGEIIRISIAKKEKTVTTKRAKKKTASSAILKVFENNEIWEIKIGIE